ncbi:extracellular solute-binding protein [Paenibacillus sp. MER TA 81-3]|uniref:ABC transporter substrate-binding protein n=1 Tax=Paenibacillus sp. MER TA 81-3 TaxID=2939573 RepID=UPI00204123FB|nr:extracellular solute-binding protein [Paenibacillus sp. MER TA 81-3]MCM3341189.1 extracellular solute-binding protein [Paenibacillus sp. MER TA 81-3]
MKRIIILLLVASILTLGCTPKKSDDADAASETLKIMYFDEKTFYKEYGMLFASKYPNIEVEVIPTIGALDRDKDPVTEMRKYIHEKNPDVLMLDPTAYEQFANEGMLYNLDALIKQDNFDLNGILPQSIGLIKGLSNGELFGLTPFFNSMAVFYNKDLFDQFHIPYPEDQMSIERFFEIIHLFTNQHTDDVQIYGTDNKFNNNFFRFIELYGSSLGLRLVDKKEQKVTFNTEAWTRFVDSTIRNARNGAIYTGERQPSEVQTYEESLFSEPFIAGKVAMTLEYYTFVNQLNEAKQLSKNNSLPNWDVVTFPVDMTSPDTTSSANPGIIFSIHSKASNTKAAWKFIKYIHSDEYAKAISRASKNLMHVRTKYIQNDEGRHMEAFYKLKWNPVSTGYSKIPSEFWPKFRDMAALEISQVLEGNISTEAALKRIEDQGNELIKLELQKN